MADGHDKGAEDTRQAAVDVKKKKVERSKERWDDGGFGYDLRAGAGMARRRRRRRSWRRSMRRR
jgi:hypothetical protein